MLRRSLVALTLVAVAWGAGAARAEEEEAEPAAIAIGERLFLETRFAQHFADASGGDVNASDAAPDPVMLRTVTADGSLPGPFRSASMNCRACHLVDEHRRTPGGGVRTYADFAVRSPVPDRGDGHAVTLRNSPSLVEASARRRIGLNLLHFDGEFATPEDLVVGTLTGRNYGWLASERDAAIRHVARVLRRDDGTGRLAREFGGPYARVLAGTSSSLDAEFRLPPRFRVDAERASDEELVRGAARIMGVYLKSLRFARDTSGRFDGSAFDRFLDVNGLPRRARPGEEPTRFAARLASRLERLAAPRFVDERDGSLRLHDRPFVFGPRELRGLRTFLARPDEGAASGVGNCAACHAPPDFTDFRFHATGVSQLEYDRAHGTGAFLELAVPSLAERNAAPADFLPPTPERPTAPGRFASIPDAARPGFADLGLWNVLFDPDRPAPQDRLRRNLGLPTDDAAALAGAVGAFKTPSLRDLGQSAPYLHDGSAGSLRDAVRFYVTVSDLARAGRLRNADPELAAIRLDDGDVADLAAFLGSLSEDYE